jgi:hypothetical protein
MRDPTCQIATLAPMSRRSMNPPKVPLRAPQPTFVDLFTPKLVTVLREGYGFRDFQADAVAGLTVAIIALPLSMAIAIGSGVSPERGLYTAIVGGFLVSLLGGSRFQIGGPAAAFIALVASIVAREGYDGLVLATLIGGVLLILTGFLQLGTFIKYIPYPVTVGFTAGIAIFIAISQIPDLFGLRIAQQAGSVGRRARHLSLPDRRHRGAFDRCDCRLDPLGATDAGLPDRGGGRCHGGRTAAVGRGHHWIAFRQHAE